MPLLMPNPGISSIRKICRIFPARRSSIFRCILTPSSHTARPEQLPRAMSEFDPESFSENDWDERGDLAWNEFDWERYLREQDDMLHRYLAHYERLKDDPGRIDEVARLMGWDDESPAAEAESPGGEAGRESAPADPPDAAGCGAFEPYTLHQNPVFVATKAIYLSLKRS